MIYTYIVKVTRYEIMEVRSEYENLAHDQALKNTTEENEVIETLSTKYGKDKREIVGKVD